MKSIQYNKTWSFLITIIISLRVVKVLILNLFLNTTQDHSPLACHSKVLQAVLHSIRVPTACHRELDIDIVVAV